MARKRQIKRQFTPEFKEQAVRLVNEGDRPLKTVARELGVGASTLWKWCEATEAPRKVAEAPVAEAPEQEVLRLRKRVRELEMEKEILKKAAANSTAQRNIHRKQTDRGDAHGSETKTVVWFAERGAVASMEGRPIAQRDRPRAGEARGVHLRDRSLDWRNRTAVSAEGFSVPHIGGPRGNLARVVE